MYLACINHEIVKKSSILSIYLYIFFKLYASFIHNFIKLSDIEHFVVIVLLFWHSLAMFNKAYLKVSNEIINTY